MTHEGYSLKLQLTKPFIVLLPNNLRLQKLLKCNLISVILDQPVLLWKHTVAYFYSVIDIAYTKKYKNHIGDQVVMSTTLWQTNALKEV